MTPPNKMRHSPAPAHWLGVGLGLLILGVAVALNLSLEHDRTAAREHDRLAAQVRVIAENMENQLTSINLALEEVRRELPRWQGSSGDPAAASDLNALTNVLPGIRTVVVMDVEGTISASNRPELVGQDFSHRAYFQAVKQHPDADMLYVSPPFITALGVFGINLTRMIPGPRGEFAGIVTATLDREYFKTLMASVLYAPDMWDAIAHGDGQLFLMVPEREGLQGMNLAQPGSFFSQHRESGQMTTVLTGTVYSTKEVRMIAQRTVHPATLKMDKPLVVAINRDLSTIFGPWRQSALTQMGLFFLIAVASVLGQRQATKAAVALQQSAERLELATEAAGVGVWDYDIVTGALVWDDSMYAIYGIDKAAVSSLYEAWHNSLLPEDQAEMTAALKATIEQNVPYAPCFRIRRGDGSLRYIQARARIYTDAAGKPVRLVGTNEDITERRRRETALQESEERFRSTFDAAGIGMTQVNLEGRFLQVNEALCRIVGYTQAELQQKSFSDITHPDDVEASLAPLRELLAGTRERYQLEKRYVHRDGHVVWVLLHGSAVRDAGGKVLYFIAQIQDVTERKALLDKLDRQAHQDFLTGLSNRRHFLERGEAELTRAERYEHALSLFMLDIDHFKCVNDTHGHKAGDIVLQKLSNILRETLRAVDVIGRIGGEEFAILLPETDLQEATEIAERLREIIARTEVTLNTGLPMHFTVSIGVATVQEKGVNLDTLLSLADQALYQAKAIGRNKVCVAAQG